MQSKIRDANLQKVPYMLIVGGREEEAQKVSIRKRGGEDLGQMTLEDFSGTIEKDIESKT